MPRVFSVTPPEFLSENRDTHHKRQQDGIPLNVIQSYLEGRSVPVVERIARRTLYQIVQIDQWRGNIQAERERRRDRRFLQCIQRACNGSGDQEYDYAAPKRMFEGQQDSGPVSKGELSAI
jgi:hypothetical protein